MAQQRLDNYLRAYRKRIGLSQDDVASLLGYKSGAQVSRYERGTRKPTLENSLAFEAILSVPARELFAGRYEKVAKAVSRRAAQLAERLKAPEAGAVRARRLRAVAALRSSRSSPL
jgi:transcriptional regulator with XRE-family HTH domain